MKALRRLVPTLRFVVMAAVFLLAIRALRAELTGYRWAGLARYVRSLGTSGVAGAALLALAGYLVMTGYDTLAFRYVDHALQYRRVALASFTSYAINNNLGLSGVVGTLLRYRFYRRWGVGNADIARVFVFCTFTYWLGFVLLGGFVFILSPLPLPPSLHLPFGSVRAFGAILLIPAGGYFLWIVMRRGPLRFRGVEITPPNRAIFAAQVAISMADWAVAARVLHIVLPHEARLAYLPVLGIFLLAQIAGLVSNVPGGLGVFETVTLLLLKRYAPPAEIIGALVTFRGVYFLLPLAIALLLLGAYEIASRAATSH